MIFLKNYNKQKAGKIKFSSKNESIYFCKSNQFNALHFVFLLKNMKK